MSTYNFINRKNSITAICLLALPMISFAQETEVASTTTYFSNALFNTLLIVSILLAVLIVALSGVLKNISSSDWLINKDKQKNESKGPNTTIVNGIIILFSLLSFSAFSQENAIVTVAKDDGRIGGLDQFTFYFMLTVIFLEMVVAGILIGLIKWFLKPDAKLIDSTIAAKPKEKTIFDKLSGAVEIEEEESIMLDHDYDGIKELDNDLPPWWKYGFYLTIVVAVIYLINYHVIKTAPLQAEEYTNSVKKAEAEIAEFMKNSADNVDENTIKFLENPADISAGKELFMNNCSACHGRSGEGTVGPNLTDNYWLHNGSLSDVFKSIKYGWADKGMKSWKEDLSPMQIAQLTSFIKTLQGTNPPNPKEKQGELYVETGSKADSTNVIVDSLSVKTVVDSLKK